MDDRQREARRNILMPQNMLMGGSTIISRFEEMAGRFGDRLAVQDEEVRWTYRELNSHSSQLAADLPDGNDPDVIGISLPRLPEVLIAMLGVLKRGASFTFIEPSMPSARKAAIVRQMGVSLVIGEHGSVAWPGFVGIWITVKRDESARAAEPFRGYVTPESIYCVIQTAGTTGDPLGVELSQAALLSTIEAYTELAQITPDDRLTVLTSPAYFAGHTAIFGGLLNGASLHPITVKRVGLRRMAERMAAERLTIYQSTPSLFRAFARSLPAGHHFPGLRFLRLGGEPVLISDYQLFRSRFSERATFVNAYGMSEAAGNIACFIAGPGMENTSSILPVGRPSRGQEIFLVNEQGERAAQGEIGEIVVRSSSLATGYFRNPALTSAKFRPGAEPAYRELWTGDLGRMAPDGCLTHHGRKGEQTKIRGQLVDLTGLESILRSLAAVREAAVIVRGKPDAANEVAAFVVPADPGVDPASIREELSRIVPDYMLPAAIRVVEEIPLTRAGKVDREALAEADDRAPAGAGSIGPRNGWEEKLTEIWRQILPASDLGIYDNVFAAGADSLTTLRFLQLIEDKYELRFRPSMVMDGPTIAQMAEYVSHRHTRKTLPWWKRLGRKTPSEAVVALNRPPAGGGLPLFICPGGAAQEHELLVYATMLPHLAADLAVFGLKQNFLVSHREVGSVPQMAAIFRREIQKIQPHGPYHLLGECISAVVVLEIARQLLAVGEEIRCLILLDPRRARIHLDRPAEFKKRPRRIQRYFRALADASFGSYPYPVDIIATEDESVLARRLEGWNDRAGVRYFRATGNHLTYIREHRRELAEKITALLLEREAAGRSKLTSVA